LQKYPPWFQLSYVVDDIMAAAGEAGTLVSLHGWKQVRIGCVDSAFLKRPGAQVTAQTLAVVVGLIKTNRIVGLTSGSPVTRPEP
jgi:hypothetical protein